MNTTAASTSSTLTAADVVNGGTGTDTMNVTVEGNVAGALPAASISGVENFYIRDVNTAGASTYNFANLDGEAQVWADRSTSTMTLSNLATGTVVGVKGNGVVANANVTFEMAKTTDAVAIALDGVKNGAGAADTVIATTTGQATAGSITTSGAASDVDRIELSDETAPAAPTIKDVTIKADANLTIGAVGGGADLIGFDVGATVTNTITVTGSATSLKLNDLADAVEVVDASAFKGGVTAVGSGTSSLTTFKGGEGADKVTVGKISSTGTVALGAGDDVFKAVANVIKSTNSVDGGAGTDTFALTAIDAANLAKFSNFEIANLDSLVAAATYDLSLLAAKNTVTGLTIDAGTTLAATVDKVAAGVGLKIVGDADSSNLTIKVANGDTGAADAFGVEFAVPTSATGAAQTPSLSVTLNEVETINLVSGGGADTTNGFTLLSTVNTLSTATNKVTQTVNVSGANQMTLNVAGSTDADVKVVVDGSTMTGKLLATGGATTTVMKGGSAADTLTVGAGKTELTGGAGKDTFVVDAAVGSTNITTITDAAAGDIIDTIGAGTTAGTKLGAATDLAGATDIATILSTLSTAALAKTTTDAAWAVVGTDVYLVISDGVDATVNNENVIKLVGVADLSNATVDAAGVITLA